MAGRFYDAWASGDQVDHEIRCRYQRSRPFDLRENDPVPAQ